MAAKMSPHKLVRLTVAEETDWAGYGEVVESTDGSVVLQVDRTRVPEVTGSLLASLQVLDLSVTDPPLEAVMRQFHAQVGL